MAGRNKKGILPQKENGMHVREKCSSLSLSTRKGGLGAKTASVLKPGGMGAWLLLREIRYDKKLQESMMWG